MQPPQYFIGQKPGSQDISTTSLTTPINVKPEKCVSQPTIHLGNTVKASFVTNQVPREKRRSHAIPIVDPRSIINTQKENTTEEELVVKVVNPYLLENNTNQICVL